MRIGGGGGALQKVSEPELELEALPVETEGRNGLLEPPQCSENDRRGMSGPETGLRAEGSLEKKGQRRRRLHTTDLETYF